MTSATRTNRSSVVNVFEIHIDVMTIVVDFVFGKGDLQRGLLSIWVSLKKLLKFNYSISPTSFSDNVLLL